MRHLDNAASKRVEAVFLEAIEKPTPSQRWAFVSTACEEVRELQQRVEALLRAHQQPRGILDEPLVEFALRITAGEQASQSQQPTLALDDTASLELLDYLQPSQAGESLGMLGPYEVERVIGRGGMGIVLRARDPRLDRRVALKVLAPVLAANDSARRRFLREARSAASVKHDHVVTIHAIDEHRGLPYLVMDYLADGSLEEWLGRHGPLMPGEVVRLGRQIALGLAAAHERGLIHRDIKPANILLENGLKRARITDFGIARAVDGVGMTSEGFAIGTPLYMSPEQATGGLLTGEPEASSGGSVQDRSLDQRSDLFSLGSLLHAMCCGRPPFSGDTPLAVIHQVCEAAPPPLRETCPQAPAWLERVVARLLAKDPDQRFQSAADVAQVLASGRPPPAIEESPASSRPAVQETPWRKSPRAAHLAIGAGLLAVVLTAVVGLVGASRGWFHVSANEQTPDEVHQPTTPPEASRSSTIGDAVDAPGQNIVVAPRQSTAPPPAAAHNSTLYGQIGKLEWRGRLHALEVSRNGKLAYVAHDSFVHVCDLTTAREIDRLTGHEGLVRQISISHDGNRLATFGADFTLRVWNTKSRKQTLRIDLPIPARRLAFSADDREILVSLYGNPAGARAPGRGTVSLMTFDVEAGKVVRRLTDELSERFWSIAWSPTGRHIAAGTFSGAVVLFDTQSGEHVRFVSHQGPVHALTFSRDGKRLYSGGNGGLVCCWNVDDGSLLKRWRMRNAVKGIDLGSDESLVLLEGTIDVRVYDTSVTGEQALSLLHGHTTPLNGLRFYGDNSHAVSIASDGTLRLWKLPPRIMTADSEE